jgi:hypothetical protein
MSWKLICNAKLVGKTVMKALERTAIQIEGAGAKTVNWSKLVMFRDQKSNHY